MAQQISVRLSESQAEEVYTIASQSHATPEEVASQALDTGLHAIRRRRFYEDAGAGSDAEKALDILQKRAGNEPPVPGDERP